MQSTCRTDRAAFPAVDRRGIGRLWIAWMRRRPGGATVACSQPWRPRLPCQQRPSRTRDVTMMTRNAKKRGAATSPRARRATHDRRRSRRFAGASTLRSPADEEARPMLLGRRSECHQLDRLLTGARAGEGDAIAVYGEPGIGKTALLEYAVTGA